MYFMGIVPRAHIAFFVCRGCQHGENDRQFPKWRLRHKRKRPTSGASWQTSMAGERYSWGKCTTPATWTGVWGIWTGTGSSWIVKRPSRGLSWRQLQSKPSRKKSARHPPGFFFLLENRGGGTIFHCGPFHVEGGLRAHYILYIHGSILFSRWTIFHTKLYIHCTTLFST